MEVELIKIRAPIGKARAKAVVDEEIAAEGELMFALIEDREY